MSTLQSAYNILTITVLGLTVSVGLIQYYYNRTRLQGHLTNQIISQINPAASTTSTCRKKKSKANNIVEICCSDIESIESSRSGGVDSVEVCSDRSQGGITASLGLIEEAVETLRYSNVELHVLIRPRPGNFVYTPKEFDIILRDILAVKDAAVDGIVVGCLDKLGRVDAARLTVIRNLTVGLQLTFHRAFDVCTNPVEGLETIINAGCDRLLTSGRSNSAGSSDGITSLAALTAQANGRIKIIAAGGVNAFNADDILSFAGVNGVHAGSSVTRLKHANVIAKHENDSQSLKLSTSEITPTIATRAEIVRIGLSADEDLESWEVADVDLVRGLVESVASSASGSWRHVSEANGNDFNQFSSPLVDVTVRNADTATTTVTNILSGEQHENEFGTGDVGGDSGDTLDSNEEDNRSRGLLYMTDDDAHNSTMDGSYVVVN